MKPSTQTDASTFIHPRAVVDRDVVLGPGTKVWQFSSVLRGAILGANCSVACNVTIDGSRFGDRCTFRPGVDIGPGVWCGDDVFLGPKITLCNDMWPRTHKHGWNVADLANGYCIIIDDGASVGAHCAVLPGVHIGKGAMCAAGTVVHRDVPAGHLWTPSGIAIPIGSEEDKWSSRIRFAC